MTNTNMLKDKIGASGFKLNYIIDKLGLTYTSFKRKMNNENEFTASEIAVLSQTLSLTDEEIMLIFLTES